MKKRKFKRFDEGGGVGDSNEGMKEAYDARIAAEEVKRKADVENEGSKISEGERISMSMADKPTRTSLAAPAAPAKPRVVSKAELEKSGLSLRDFLNKERGLTRRADSSAPAKAEPKPTPKVESKPEGAYRGNRSDTKVESKPEGAYRGMRSDAKTESKAESYTPPRMTAEMRKKAEAQAISPVYPEEYLAMGAAPGLRTVAGLAKKLANRVKPSKSMASDAPYLQELGYTPTKIGSESLKLGMKKGGAVKKKPVAKYASGGSVSSASRRADGIATKGKTRGKMC
jgi:hypothetical protein